MEIKTTGPRLVHVEKLREGLKKEPVMNDELLREHIRKLRIAWYPMALLSEKVA